MIKTDLAYIAGFLDSDGCITVSWGRKTKAGHRISVPLVSFYNRDLKTLEWIKSIFGGKIYNKPRKDRTHSIARQLTLRSQNGEVLNCLKNVRPYLRIKYEQADCVIQLIESRIKRGWLGTSKHLPPTSEETTLAEKTQWLNQNRYFKNDQS